MQVTTVGLDITKDVVRVHGVDARGRVVLRKRLSRAKVLTCFANLPRAVIGLEAIDRVRAPIDRGAPQRVGCAIGEESSLLTLQIVKRVQADLTDLKEGRRAANMYLASIEGHMRGFHLTTSAHTDDTARLEERVERIERCLDLANADACIRRALRRRYAR